MGGYVRIYFRNNFIIVFLPIIDFDQEFGVIGELVYLGEDGYPAIEVGSEKITIGNNEQIADVVIEDVTISKIHALIEYIGGDYFLEDHYKSIIRFYNGDTNSTWELASVYNSGCITVKANTGPLTIRFIVDTETPEAGFEFSINACPDKANNINSFNISDSSSEINWHAGNDSTNWIIEYNTWHFSLGQGIRQSSDTNYIKLEELNSCTDYYYYILTDFDIQEPLCSHYAGLEINHFRTTNELSPLAYDLEIEATEHSLEFSWSETDTK